MTKKVIDSDLLHYLYIDCNLGIVKISKMIKCHNKTVVYSLHECGIEVRPNTIGVLGRESPMRGKHHSEESKIKIARANTGKTVGVETRKKMSEGKLGDKNPRFGKPGTMLGKHPSAETIAKISGENNPSWQEGVTPETTHIRNSPERAEWRMHVFGRDHFTCLGCGARGVTFNAHHILSFSKYPELRLVVSNGITLCETCHRNIRGKEEELEEYCFNKLFGDNK
jgi:hypothetical protein